MRRRPPDPHISRKPDMAGGFVRVALSRSTVTGALKLALCTGTLLNAVNQLGPVLAGAEIAWLQLLLNYAMPYGVSSYSIAKATLARAADRR